MSEELQDEVEALNSIYGDGTLSPSGDPDIYILQLPGGNSNGDGDLPSSSTAPAAEDRPSLRLRLPASYPDEPPAVLGTHSSGGRAPGAAARHLALFRQALGAAYQPGAVCLFDALEELARLREDEDAAIAAAAAAEEEEEEDGDNDGGHEEERRAPAQRGPEAPPSPPPTAAALLEPPPWVTSDPIVEMRSTFIARCARVTSPAQAASFVAHLLATDRQARAATHNMTAWRIRGAGGTGTTFQDCDDDGEQAAGGRLLHLMQLMDLWDVMVVVSRWYGGKKLGPRRFAVINQAARDVFVRAGLVPESGAAKKKGHK
ncbi:impact family protein [Gaeumannomyces tritici R3-111a-1]|uniref:Impact family protein n=1 Tax=Gaeumannomyces tritici (strain R3-111a-1) TaxID=644352 RepID=J3PGD2_GAET3|nr:impact family protein [Gaeumannomyces tritici R3-111a-1]EJT69673.1 impact family protein [Gaeumannomyces tritici R3-111a-1]